MATKRKLNNGLADDPLDQFLMHLRNVVDDPYKKKHGRSLNWESGWAWEALAFIDNEIGKPKK